MTSLERRTLARAAARLNARSAHIGRVPPLVLMTDDDRLANPLAAVHALPRGSVVIVRSRKNATRETLAMAVMKVAPARGLIVLIAGDPKLAMRLGADGLHLSEARAHEVAHWRTLRPHWFITAAAHSMKILLRVRDTDALILAPIHVTESHPKATALGPLRAANIARHARLPVYALGGVGPRNASGLPLAFAGIAAIGALAV